MSISDIDEWLQMMDDYLIISNLIYTWKGTSSASLSLIFKQIDKFKATYGKKAFYIPVEDLLWSIANGYPEKVHDLISDWAIHRVNFKETSAREFAEQFEREVRLALCNIHKVTRDMRLNGDLNSRGKELLEKAKCADLFYPPVGTATNDSSNSTSSTTNETRESLLQKIHNHERHRQVFMRAFAKHPELCPNCLAEHPLLMCMEIQEDPRDNLAAWIVVDYEAQTKEKRYRYMKTFAKKSEACVKRK